MYRLEFGTATLRPVTNFISRQSSRLRLGTAMASLILYKH